jgi:PAS domain S-box-containing protein
VSKEKNTNEIASLKAQISELENKLAAISGSKPTMYNPENLAFEQFAENIPDTVLIHNMEGQVFFINDVGAKLLGYDEKSELIGQNLIDMTPPELINEAIERKELREKGDKTSRKYTFEVLAKDKTRIPVEAQSSIISYNEQTFVFVILHDITEQKKLETERQNIQNRLQRAENIANIGNWEFDLNNNRVNTSAGAQQIYGLSTPEMTIADVQKIPLPQYREYLDKALQALVNEGKAYNVSFKIKRLNDNQLRDIQSIAEYDAETNKVFGVIRDITREKRQQQEIEESEARFRTLFNENTSVMMLIEPDTGEIVDVNNAAINFYGYSKQTLCSMKIQQINTLTPEEINLEIEKARNGKKNVFQFKHRLRNGKIRNVEVYSGPIKLQSRTLLYSTIHDVTDRYKALKGLKESEERLRLALSASKQGLWDINLANKTTNISPEYAEMLGYTYETFKIDKYWEKNLHPDDYEATTARFWGYINGEYDDYKMEFRLRTKSGNYKWILSRGKIIEWDKNNKPLRMIGIHMDISKMKQVETELLEAKEKAESSNRLKTAFLQNMSHEIRTPMNGIMGFSELLKEDEIDEIERNEYIDIIHRNSQQLLQIVNDILDISRLDTGEIKIQKQNVDLPALIEMENRFFEKQAEAKGLYLKTEINQVSNKGKILSDSNRIKQILDNLISNAVKFTKEGGITISLTENSDHLIVSVIDTGLGIPKESYDIIFKRFEQIHTHLVEGGTGLGLPISKKLAKMLGGELTFSSEPNKGSTFKLFLPKFKA